MIINSTKINYTMEQATEAVINELGRKSMFTFFREMRQYYEPAGEAKLIYFPYWIGLTSSNISIKLLGKKIINLIIAVEGYKGEAGISLGLPDAAPMEVSKEKIVELKIDEDEAHTRIKSYAVKHIVRRNKHLPEVTIHDVGLIWKPTYVIPIYSHKNDRVIYKLVDAESNYLIYRYDMQLSQLMSTVPELRDIAVQNYGGVSK